MLGPDRQVERARKGEHLDSRHFPEVGALLRVEDGHHLDKQVFIQHDDLAPLVQQHRDQLDIDVEDYFGIVRRESHQSVRNFGANPGFQELGLRGLRPED